MAIERASGIRKISIECGAVFAEISSCSMMAVPPYAPFFIDSDRIAFQEATLMSADFTAQKCPKKRALLRVCKCGCAIIEIESRMGGAAGVENARYPSSVRADDGCRNAL